MTARKSLTRHLLRDLHSRREKIAMLTCYDAPAMRAREIAIALSIPLIGIGGGEVLVLRDMLG
jgi:ketopantoate hydroxymethyltransferase